MTEDPLGPLIAYATGIMGLLMLIVRSVPDIFGPIGRWVKSWTDQKVRVRAQRITAEVRELQTSVHVLEEALAEMREKARVHTVWDRRVYTTLLTHGIADDLGVPPDLF